MTPILEVRGVCKSFPGVRALDAVDLDLARGEVLAVVGENGAGKSTLMKILAGVQRPDSGELRIDGEPVALDSVSDALALGITLIHQELNLADNLDVGANLFLGREPRRFGLIDEGRIVHESRALLARVGLDVDPRQIVGTLAIGHQQLVEVAKALAVDARILIMDEPTSSLSLVEAERLFAVIGHLRERGVSVIYISHRLGEVTAIADRVVVLRDGCRVGELTGEAITHDRMVSLMVGRDVTSLYERRALPPGKVRLEVRGLRTRAWPAETLDFTVRAGEIVAVAGLVGAGRSEMLAALFGVGAPLAGTVHVDGEAIDCAAPVDAVRAGLALVPEDRKVAGLILDLTVRENTALAALSHRSRRGFLDRPYERALAVEMIGRLGIRTPGPEQIARLLSGGNQQKVVLAKWLAVAPRVFLFDEPTRGVDVGAKEEIYRLMEELAADGAAILFVSSELEEVRGLADRVLVMCEGRLAGELARAELGEEAIMQLATSRRATA